MADGGILVVLAHPDDESLISGTMARYTDAGMPVTMLCATRGEAGEIAPGTDATPDNLGEHRERELRDACAIVGVHDVRLLPFRDSGMAGTPENNDPRSLAQASKAEVVSAMAGVMRDVRPRAVLTWDATGGYGHPDHMKVHVCATEAFETSGAARNAALFYSVIPIEEFTSAMEEMRRRGIEVGDPPGDPDAMDQMEMVRPNCIIDVAAQLDRKQQALRAHRTQAGSFDMFDRMPEDLSRRFFEREYFHRAIPPLPAGVTLDGLFEGEGR
ncbi:MAG TPA: PIG-L family deacetylase [Dehalococcoidia bacterium]|nr:PIG-L family deacetylase [Dehalococcoidia bacterium]